MSTQTGPPARERWAARAALAAAALAVALPLAFGGVRGFLLLLAALAAMAVAAAALWWALTRRGAVRWIAGLLAVVLPLAVVVVLALTLLWTLLLSPVLWIIAVWCGRYALRSARGRVRPMKEHRTPPPRRPFVLMNPRSGGGKVERFGLVEKAERLGARVVLLDPEQHQDVTELARQAVADGADLLGVAGGDGTQALGAAVAAVLGLPVLVVSAGTR
ncbi:diacylglycerol kinase family protein, partial [Streptomyces sp. NPDC058398]|uniref:diacylglycerol kinase family protein n=1 Tax=Streptomyces sp. NPDC058398 TaxID=3346479 RepID=UPI003663B240